MDPDPVRLVRRRGVEPRKPGGTETLTGVLQLGFVLDDRDAQLDRPGVFLFGARERDGCNDSGVPSAL